MNNKLRILLLDNNRADIEFFNDVLSELKENHFTRGWLPPYDLVEVEMLGEALALIEQVAFDVIVTTLWLDDSSGVATFKRLSTAAPRTGIIVLTQKEDPGLTLQLVREGAQEVLGKTELDCGLLGRSIRCAIERNRIAQETVAMGVRDSLTGLLNYAGLSQVGEMVCQLAQHLPATSAIAQIQVSPTESGESASWAKDEWLLIETAELLRSCAFPTDTIAYVGRGRFVLLSPMRDAARLQPVLYFLASQVRLKALSSDRGEVEARVSARNLTEENGWELDRAMSEADDALVSVGAGSTAAASPVLFQVH